MSWWILKEKSELLFVIMIMKSFLPVLVIALGSRVKAEGERDLIYLMRWGFFHHLSSSKYELFWPDMDTWRAKRGQQPCRLRKESEGRSRKLSWIFRSESRFLFFVVFVILISSRHLLVWTRQELWMEKHEKWWRHQGENWLSASGDSLWCWLKATAQLDV